MKLRNRIALIWLWLVNPWEYIALRKRVQKVIAKLMEPHEIFETELCLECLKRLHDWTPPPNSQNRRALCGWCEAPGRVYLFRHHIRPASLPLNVEYADWSEAGILEELIEKRRKR